MRKILVSAALAASSLLVLAGCAAGPADGSKDGGSGDGRVQVVASTNVYGDIARQIAGDRADVTSLIDDAAKDPHSYEATARDRLAVQKADLIIENGGGYDSFVETLREGSGAPVIVAAEFSHDYPGDPHEHDASTPEPTGDAHDAHAGHDHIEGFNEHVWFDVHTITHVVEQVTTDLVKLDAAGKSDYEAASKKFIGELNGFETQLEGLHTELEGTKVVMTEPLPGLLAAAAGLDDVTPDGFASAVEEGNDVPPAILLETTRLISSGEVKAVLANAQTGGGETDKVEQAAKAAGVPVLTFSELLKSDQTYAEWMHAAITDLAAALHR
jgi:zinc/manganese transport system substrate-binding protein